MGLDRWSTPKQIKIEREGEPRGVHRGPLKKGQRRKGQKARLDELLSSKKTLLWYVECIVRDRETRKKHPEWYKPVVMKNGRVLTPWESHWGESFDEHEKKHFKLIGAAVKDGVIDDPTLWMVIKP